MKRNNKRFLGLSLLLILVLALGGYWTYTTYFSSGRQPSGTNSVVSSVSDQSLVVDTKAGRVSGQRENKVISYLGLPYAEARERFVRAQAVEPWDGILEANSYGKISPQGSILGMSAGSASADEDNNSQNLNIWTPAVNDNGKRPVMVWLHGGGFSMGSANESMYNGANLAGSQDVVVVGVNHRLNTYGYLDLSAYGDKYKDSANVGMWDIIDSLKWIQDNIEQFGGDPDNVTVFGQSGGGAKVLALMTSPEAKGLFQRAIVQSGATETMGVRFTDREVSQALSQRILEKLNISENNIDAIQNVSNSDLQAAADEAREEIGRQYQIPAPLSSNQYRIEWAPVVDGDFLPTNPIKDNGEFADAGRDIPLLIGSNINEWAGMGGTIYNNMTSEQVALYEEAYPEFSATNAPYVDSFIRLPMIALTNAKAQQNAGNVYSYMYTYGGDSNSSQHGAEIPAVFDNSGAMADRMSSLWASFARTGQPSAQGVPTWEAYTRDQGATMILNTDSRLAYHHDLALMRALNPNSSLLD